MRKYKIVVWGKNSDAKGPLRVDFVPAQNEAFALTVWINNIEAEGMPIHSYLADTPEVEIRISLA